MTDEQLIAIAEMIGAPYPEAVINGWHIEGEGARMRLAWLVVEAMCKRGKQVVIRSEVHKDPVDSTLERSWTVAFSRVPGEGMATTGDLATSILWAALRAVEEAK